MPLPVELVRRDGTAATEYAVNLSPGGICLHLAQPPGVGEAVELAFELPPAGERIRARGRVIWCDDPKAGAGVRFRETGVRFEGLGEAERDAIARFVRRAEGEAEGR